MAHDHDTAPHHADPGHTHGHAHGHARPHAHDDGHADGHGHAHDAGGHAGAHDAHAHGHHHHHAHVGNAAGHGRAFAIAIALNAAFVAVELGYGWAANSTALVADAGHNLSDVLGLLLAWGGMALARRTPSRRYTYGLRSSSILAALANAMLLLVACGAIGWEAVQRFAQPPAVAGVTVMVIAGAGIVVNGVSAWLFMRGSAADLNLRGAYLHMAADAAVSLGVVVTGLVMMGTGWYWLDPLTSLVIVAVIVAGTWGLLRESLHLVLDAVPPHIDGAAVAAYLQGLPGVRECHDLHIWGMSTTESALTAHLVMPGGAPADAVVDAIRQTLHDRFRIQHSTLQIEQGTTRHACCLDGTPTPAR